jgi:hypothetical protein
VLLIAAFIAAAILRGDYIQKFKSLFISRIDDEMLIKLGAAEKYAYGTPVNLKRQCCRNDISQNALGNKLLSGQNEVSCKIEIKGDTGGVHLLASPSSCALFVNFKVFDHHQRRLG